MSKQTATGFSRGLSSASTDSSLYSAEVHYKKPVVYMVPFHEVTEMTQEDWFFQISSLLASIVLGAIAQKLIDESTIPIYLTIFGLFSALLLAYHFYRIWRKEKKMQELKDKAIQIPVELPKAYTSGSK